MDIERTPKSITLTVVDQENVAHEVKITYAPSDGHGDTTTAEMECSSPESVTYVMTHVLCCAASLAGMKEIPEGIFTDPK